jgi:alkanesulfonate monooxygenase SsuD/methylene tetrahydromethanopterin reductase-like flavin-dependent oxidoreductase (luciferase family)
MGAAWHPINLSVADIQSGRAELKRLCQEQGRATPPAVTLRNDVRVLRAGESAPLPLHGGRVLAGEPSALADQINELSDAGVEHLVVEFLASDAADLEEQMTLFAQRVRGSVR